MLKLCLEDFEEAYPDRDLSKLYVYLTAKHGWAVPGNPLNREGWHTDGFGTDDINYVWTKGTPTVYAVHEFGPVSDDDTQSIKDFTAQVRVTDTFPNALARIDRWVVHSAPSISEPELRSFLKVSISENKYDMLGNAHNYEFNYKWDMKTRRAARNLTSGEEIKEVESKGIDYFKN